MEQQWMISNDSWVGIEKALQEGWNHTDKLIEEWDGSVVAGWEDVPVLDMLGLSDWEVDLSE